MNTAHTDSNSERNRASQKPEATSGHATDYCTPLYGGARGAAIRILSRIDQSDSYLDKVLEKELELSELSSLDKSLLTEIVHGVVRWQAKLDWVLTGFYHGEFAKCITPVKNAMRIALYQIMFLDKIPPFAAVNESVEIIKRIKGVRSANVVNAVLRNILHHIKEIRYPKREEDVARYFAIVYSHPQWMVKRWIEQFGEEQTEVLLQANNRRPPLTLRVNTLQTSTDDFTAMLRERKVAFSVSPYEERSIVMQYMYNIRSAEAYGKGMFSVQDVSATLAARLAAPAPGALIYDLCAAPGGKATFLAELSGDTGKIVALDKYEAKLRYIRDNAQRLKLNSIEAVAADARTFAPSELADVVLVDAPCSGTGTLSKKPDIKWKREIEDIRIMVEFQKQLLAHAATLVRPGGTLVYSTCSIEPEENTAVAEWFASNHPEFTRDNAEAYLPAEVCKDGYLQMFPHVHRTDGSFAARFVRKTMP